MGLLKQAISNEKNEIINGELDDNIANEQKDYANLYKTIVDLSPDSIVTINLKGNITYVNPSGLKMMGFTKKEEVLGKHFSKLNIFPLKELPKYLMMFSNIIRGKPVEFLEIEFLRQDGTRFLAEVRVSLLREAGKITGIQAISRDITELKKIKKEIESNEIRYISIVENMNDGLYILDFNGNILDVNSKACEMLGYDRLELINHHLVKIYKEDNKEFVNQKIQELIKKGSMIFDAEHIMKSGKKKSVSISTRVVSYEGSGIIHSIVRDISERKLFEEELEKSRESYRLLAENVSDVIYTRDMHQQFTYISPSAELLSGYTLEELYKMDIRNIMTPESYKKQFTLMQNKLASHKNLDEPMQVEMEIIKKSGEQFWAEANVRFLLDESNNPIGVIGVLRNIEYRKQMEKELFNAHLELKNALESANAGTLKLDIPNNYLQWDRRSMEIFGITKDTFGNNYESWANLVHPDDLQKIQPIIDAKLANPDEKYIRIEYRVIKPNNEIGYVIASAYILRDVNGKAIGLSGIHLDYTKQKQIEDEIKDLNKHLDQKVKERAQEIEKLLDQKDAFITQLGHDLRTPLSPLLSLLPILEKKTENEENREIVKMLLSNTRSVKKLVNKTLKLAKLNAPSTVMMKVKISLQDEINHIIDIHSFIFDEKKVVINNNVSEDIVIDADKLYFDELITNLISNAIKYSNTEVTIDINAVEKDDGINISIKDNGIGLSSEQLNYIFDEFYKADPSRHDYHSTGLGMAISKRIIDKHNGRIWVESEGLGKGSTFIFSLPKSNH